MNVLDWRFLLHSSSRLPNKPFRERMARLGFASLAWSVSQPISYPFGSLLFDSGGYVCVFSTSLLLFVTASLLGLFRLWGFEEKLTKQEASLKGKVSPKDASFVFFVLLSPIKTKSYSTFKYV